MCNTTITIYRGDTVKLPFAMIDWDGEFIDISGATVNFMSRGKDTLNNTDDTGAQIDESVTVFTNPEQGQWEVSLSTSDTDIPIGSYVRELSINRPNGDVTTATQWELVVLQDAKKA